jgi:FtsH-binding integral membrane protein
LPVEDVNKETPPDPVRSNPPEQRNASDPPLFMVFAAGFGITGISVLAVFRGTGLGYFFLLSGAVVLALGLFFAYERKRF